MTIANQDYAVSFVVEQTPAQAFSAIIDARSWWSSTIEGQLDRAGETINYSYGDMHRCRMEVTDVVPNEAVIWHVVENYFSFADSAAEWVGTDLVFNIVPTSKGTEVTFTHVGLVPAAKCYSVSSSAWTDAILGSLQQLITTGKGSVNAA